VTVLKVLIRNDARERQAPKEQMAHVHKYADLHVPLHKYADWHIFTTTT
jgi:hypothetical protein